MATETEELDAGSVIGNYRVVRLLGQGGMGTVYEVEHLELGTHYALKTFTFDPENAASQALKAKFLEEGKLLARLKHPNLTHVFDLGFEEKTQMPYFVMDLVTYEDGETYTVEDIDLGDIDEELVYKWFGQLASALDYIHGEGIVHRDVKPSNLLLDADLNVILTDFGISRIFGAKIKEEVDAMQTMVAKTGRGKLVLGTEHYIAPEVANGEEATPRADAYSLGVMLLRWLTGFYYGDNPGAIAMLSGKKYRWLGVIAKLVAPAGRRPENYTELVKLLKVNVQAKPEETERRKRARKKRNAIQNLIAVALGLAIAVGIAAGGYCLWRHFERLNVERDQKFAALQRQIREKDEAEARAKAEAETARKAKVSEESRLAEEKRKAREAKPAPTLVETHQETLPVAQDRRNEKPVAEKAVERDAQENRPKIVAETVTPAPVDYGPIPNVRYLWHDKRDETKPLQVRFQLANGATVDLMPMKKGSFFMSNMDLDDHDYHKVTLTYDFWMTKFLVTAKQWREYAPYDCEDCKPVEKAIGDKYPVCQKVTFNSITNYCAFLTRKYISQLPDGYVIRLPTEAELERVEVGQSVMFDILSRDWIRQWGGWVNTANIGKGRLSDLIKDCRLMSLGAWESENLKGTDVFIMGLANPFESGVYDCWIGMIPISDRFGGEKNDPMRGYYQEEEIDPLKIGAGKTAYSVRRWQNFRERVVFDGHKMLFHFVVAPALDKLRREQHIGEQSHRLVEDRRYDWSVPRKLARSKELKFKLSNGAEMIFCACPAGRFVMSNVSGQSKSCHEVTITRSFWMTKYLVSVEQWRDFGKYECEGVCRILEEELKHKFPISVRKRKSRVLAFCRYLTERYKGLIPDGYVFRLPTDAELEYAMKSGGDSFPQGTGLILSASEADRLVKLVKKSQRLNRMTDWIAGGRDGRILSAHVGGRSEMFKWGFYDLNLETGVHVLDSGFYDEKDWWEEGARKCLVYDDKMTDPCGWTGRGTRKKHSLMRYHWGNRRMVEDDCRAFAHIVVGPDLIAEKNAAENKATVSVMPKIDDADIPKPISLELKKGNVIEFEGCPKGEFVMGDASDESRCANNAYKPHRVSITRPYWLSKFKVTQRQWNIYEKSPATKYDEAMGGLDVPFHRGTSYQKAMRYCEFLTKRFRAKLPKGYVIRLPTEAEWEFALRVRDTAIESKYANWHENRSAITVERKDVLMHAENARFDLSGFKSYEYAPIAVGAKLPNGLGLYDMIGNGFEMTLDLVENDGSINVSKPCDESKGQTALSYADKEVDPIKYAKFGLNVVRGAEYNNMEGNPWCKRVNDTSDGERNNNICSFCIRLCIGPDLLKEKGLGKAMKKNRGGKK